MNLLADSFGPLGTPELVILAILVLVLFGARKLPTFGRSLSRSMGEFRRAKEAFERELMRSVDKRDQDRRDLPAADDFEAAENLQRQTFRHRCDWRGRNLLVVAMMLLCVALLAIAFMRMSS